MKLSKVYGSCRGPNASKLALYVALMLENMRSSPLVVYNGLSGLRTARSAATLT